jgi:2-C-methyl-D-erythritol 4-phosphate cytidylyltransferase / 2-C-methyl-D-erythritol 2,4-cyclodiphosphate synthase
MAPSGRPANEVRYWLVMPAAGAGRRFGGDTPKQYARLLGRSVIEWALAPFLADPRCAHAVVVIADGDRSWPGIAARLSSDRVSAAAGGVERSESVRRGLAALGQRARADDWVLVHDAARPCLDPNDLERLIAAACGHRSGGLLAARAADTLKEAPPGEAAPAAAHTLDRSRLWRALTPQMFRFGALCAALDAAHAAGRFPSDEAQALEWQGERPLLIEAAAGNLKLTTGEDLELAAAVLGARAARSGEGAMRIGSGFDVHAFGPGDHLMLGGVRVPHSAGAVAHSDGDVLLHALCDALLGAAGLGDIGQHFADSDPRWRGADSRQFVTTVLELLRERGLRVVNADLTLLAQAPRIAPHAQAIRQAVAALLALPEDCVNVKATTTEGLGFLGRAEGVAAQAVVLLRAG